MQEVARRHAGDEGPALGLVEEIGGVDDGAGHRSPGDGMDLEAPRRQGRQGVAADEAGGAGDQNPHTDQSG